MYKVYEAEGIKFYVKFDLINGESLAHMYHRHTIKPEEAITAFFNQTHEIYNQTNMRYEVYSKETDITVFYAYRHNKQNEILLITAIKGEIL